MFWLWVCGGVVFYPFFAYNQNKPYPCPFYNMDYEVEISEGQFLDLQSNKGAANYPLPSSSGLQKDDTVTFYEVDGSATRTGNWGRGVVRFANDDFFAVLPTGTKWYFLSPLNMFTWQDITAQCTFTGWSSFTIQKLFACKAGSLIHLSYHLSGTSNSTLCNIVLPYTTPNDGATQRGVMRVTNNGVVSNTIGMAQMAANSNQLDFYRDQGSTAWTNANGKAVSGVFIIRLANP